MAKYRKVDTRIWRDEKFLSLDEGSQWLFLHLLTSPYTTMIGTLAMTTGMLSEFIRNRSETVSKRLRNLSERGLIEVDDHGLIWIRNFLKYNTPSNPNMAKGILDVLDDLPECELQKTVIKQAIEVCRENGFEVVAKTIEKQFGNRLETVSKPFRNKEQEHKQEQEQEITTTTGVENSPSSETEPFPYKQVVELFHEMCPKHRKVSKVTDNRRSRLKARAEDMRLLFNSEDVLSNYGRLFEIVRSSKFLSNESDKGEGHEHFEVDFDWILNQNNFTKIVEGKYSEAKAKTPEHVSKEVIERNERLKAEHIAKLRAEEQAKLDRMEQERADLLDMKLFEDVP